MGWEAVTIIVGAIIAVFGGGELVRYILFRKHYTRKKRAEAKDAEMSLHERQIDAYERRLSQRDAKVDEIYRELRETQKRELSLIQEIGELRVTNKTLEIKKCEVKGCVKRKPPRDF